MRTLLASFLFIILQNACTLSEEQSAQFRQRMKAESDSLCVFNQVLATEMKDSLDSHRQMAMMQYRVKLSDRLMFVQYDHVPSADSMLWLTVMHVLRNYHQQTYSLVPALVLNPEDSQSRDSLRTWENQLWKRCNELLSTDFKISDSCRLSAQWP